MLTYPIKTRYLTDEQGVPNSVVLGLADWQEILRLLELRVDAPEIIEKLQSNPTLRFPEAILFSSVIPVQSPPNSPSASDMLIQDRR